MPQYLGQIVDQGGQVFNVNAYRPAGGTDQQAVDAAIAAIAGTTNQGGILYFPPGTFTVNVVLPGAPATVHVQGSGIGATRLVSGTATDPVIRHKHTDGDATRGVVVGGFTVVPHAGANASTPSLIDLAGFSGCTFRDIGYAQNPSASASAGWPLAMFTLASHRAGGFRGCYDNLITHVVVHAQQYGPRNVILFENDGTGDALYNANAIVIEQLWAYSNGNVDYVVDALRSALVVVRDSLIEDNRAATAVRLGTRTTVESTWFEANLATIAYAPPPAARRRNPPWPATASARTIRPPRHRRPTSRPRSRAVAACGARTRSTPARSRSPSPAAAPTTCGATTRCTPPTPR
jgi:hypothetical protein